MKRQRIKKIFGFILLAILILEMIVLIVEALTPGTQSAAQSGAVGDILDNFVTDFVGDEGIYDVPPESISILSGGKSAHRVEIGIGNTLRLNVDFLPNDTSANYRKVVWSSADPSVVEVDDGLLRARRIGRTTVTASLEADPGITATISVSVNEIFATALSLEFAGGGNELTLTEGRTATLRVNLSPGDATAKSDIRFTSSDGSVATVSGSGVVRAVAEGDATITATYCSRTTLGGTHVELSATATVHVEPDLTPVIPPTGLRLRIPNDVMVENGVNFVYAGTESAFGCLISPEDCTDRLLVWQSSDESVLRVDGTGKFTALKKGVATVRVFSANAPTVYREITLTVRNRALNVSLNVAASDVIFAQTEDAGEYTLRVAAGSNIPLSVTSSAAEIFLRYETSDASVAEVTGDGTLLTYHTGSDILITITVSDSEDFLSGNGDITETFTVRLTVTRQSFSTTVGNWGLLIRKLFGHFGAFLVLGMLCGGTAVCFDKKSWKRRIFLLLALILFGFAFAGLTEILQLPIFTAGRGAAFSDVLIDFSGYLPGFFGVYGIFLIIVFIVERVRAHKNRKSQQ